MWSRPSRICRAAAKQDMTATDGQKLTLGDTTVTIYTTPGHTLGTLSLVFPVKDHGRPLTVAYSAARPFNFRHEHNRFDTYIASQRKMQKVAAEANATVLLSNHSLFDSAYDRTRLAGLSRPAGEPHPLEVGADGDQRYGRQGAGRVRHRRADQGVRSLGRLGAWFRRPAAELRDQHADLGLIGAVAVAEGPDQVVFL